MRDPSKRFSFFLPARLAIFFFFSQEITFSFVINDPLGWKGLVIQLNRRGIQNTIFPSFIIFTDTKGIKIFNDSLAVKYRSSFFSFFFLLRSGISRRKVGMQNYFVNFETIRYE